MRNILHRSQDQFPISLFHFNILLIKDKCINRVICSCTTIQFIFESQFGRTIFNICWLLCQIKVNKWENVCEVSSVKESIPSIITVGLNIMGNPKSRKPETGIRNRKPESGIGTGNRNPESGIHKSKKTSASCSRKLFSESFCR